MDRITLAAQAFRKRSAIQLIIRLLYRHIGETIGRMGIYEVMGERLNLMDHLSRRLREEGGGVTPGRMHSALRSHLLNRLLNQRLDRLAEIQEVDLGPYSDMSDNHIRSFLMWRPEHPGSTVEDWKRLRRKIEQGTKGKTGEGVGGAHKTLASYRPFPEDDSPVERRQHDSGGGGVSEGRGGQGGVQVRPKKESRAYLPRRKGTKKD